MRRLVEKGALWLRAHPKVTGAIGLGAATAAGVYGGPGAAAAVNKILPVVCTALKLCE